MTTKFGYSDQTGLLFIDGVAFTKDRLNIVRDIIKRNKDNQGQFEYDILIQDNINNAVIAIDQEVLNEIEAYIAMNNLNLAEDKDFEQNTLKKFYLIYFI